MNMDQIPEGKSRSPSGQTCLHPLMVDLILQQLLDLLDLKSLKSARQVCRRWNDFASEPFLSKTHLDLVHAKEHGKLVELFEYFANGSCEPFKNISLTLSSGERAECELLRRTVRDILEPLKDSISSLHFDACYDIVWDRYSQSTILGRVLMLPLKLEYLSLSVLPKAIVEKTEMFLKNPPNPLALRHLKTFRLYGRCVYSEKFLEVLIRGMPNVKTIILKDQPMQTTEIFLKLLLKYNVRDLKELCFEGLSFMQGNDISSLANGKFQLEYLKIDFSWLCNLSGPKEYFDKCNSLLSSLSGTLKELRVIHKGGRRLQGSNLVMPHLPELKVLNLAEWGDFGTLDFMDNLPNLQVLQLGSIIKNYQWLTPPIPLEKFVPEKISVYPKLKELDLIPVELPKESFRRFLTSFPNLRKLSMKGTDDLLNILFQEAPPIEELILVRDSQISDFGVTAIPPDSESLERFLSCDAGFDKNRSSIKSLHHLRRLEIDGFYSTITDDSISFGLKFLKNLTSLSMENCDLTPSSLKELGELPLLHLDLTNSLIEGETPWKIVVLAEIERLKKHKPYLFVINYQEEVEPFVENIL